MKICMRRSAPIAITSALTAGLMSAVVAGSAGEAAAAPATTTTTVAAAADGYTDAGAPRRVVGSAAKLTASKGGKVSKTTFVKFAVPAAPANATLASARLQMTPKRVGTTSVAVRGVSSTSWAESTLAHKNAPTLGSPLDVAAVNSQTKAVSLDVTPSVKAGQASAFAVTVDSGFAAFNSREAGSAGPRLVLTYSNAAAKSAPVITWAAPAAITAGTALSATQLNAKANVPGTFTYTPGTGTKLAAGTQSIKAVFTPTDTARYTTAQKTVQVTVTSSTSPISTPTGVRIGMSAPRDQWDGALADTGGVDARRLFGQLSSPDSWVSLARSEVAAGRMPILSFKVPNNDWAGTAAGKYDANLRDLTNKLAAVPGRVFVTLHHEPTGDGTPADYAAMQRHALPILGAPANVDAGVIVNGYWWSAAAQGYTDAEIAQWLPADVLRLSEVVAADTYQGGTTAKIGENAGVKITRMSAWATRVGVTKLGIGEYNGLDAASIKAAGDAVLADPRFVFASCFNSSENNRVGVDWKLTGDRLTAFKQTLQKSRELRATS